jgi:hypothetical protein
MCAHLGGVRYMSCLAPLKKVGRELYRVIPLCLDTVTGFRLRWIVYSSAITRSPVRPVASQIDEHRPQRD